MESQKQGFFAKFAQDQEASYLGRGAFVITLFIMPVLTYLECEITRNWPAVLAARSFLAAYSIFFIWYSFRQSWSNKSVVIHARILMFLLYLYAFVGNSLIGGNAHFSMLSLASLLGAFILVNTIIEAYVVLFITLCSVAISEFFIPQHDPETLSYFLGCGFICAMGFAYSLFRISQKETWEREHQLYQLLAKNSMDIISVHDVPSNRILYVSPAIYDALGFLDTEIIGKPNDYLQVEEDKPYLYKLMHPKTFLRQNIVMAQYRVRTFNKNYIWVESSNRAIIKDGKLLQVITITRNIEERKKAESDLMQYSQELEKANANLKASNFELERFSFVASHDLKEPLRTVASYVQLLERRYNEKLDEEGREYIRYAVKGVKRMYQLIADLFSYSKVGASLVNLEKVDCAEVLQEIQDALARKIQDTAAVIETEKLPVVWADRFQITQLFQNLLDNAMKYRVEGQVPVIQVRFSDSLEDWHFVVSDNGIGIHPDFLERIFEIFSRLHNNETYEGTGVGLAICQRVVANHQGKIWVESEPGQGSHFHFTIAKRRPEVL